MEQKDKGEDNWEPVISTWPIPCTIYQLIADIVKMRTPLEGNLEDLRCINEWHKVIAEDETGPLDVERGQEELSNAWPRGFLLIDKKSIVWGVHSVGMANLPDQNLQMHRRTYGFIGNMYQVDDGTWAIPGMTEINPAEMFNTQSICENLQHKQNACKVTSSTKPDRKHCWTQEADHI
jgi:hypothetical protein